MPNLQSTNLLITCDLVSQRPLLPLGGRVSAQDRPAVAAARPARPADRDDGTVRVWDLAVGAAPRMLTGHAGPVQAVAVSADGRTAASG